MSILREEVADAMGGMYRRSQECHDLRVKGKWNDEDSSRLRGKQMAYAHCGDIIKEVLKRTAHLEKE
jgi:hypothetical protein